MNKSKAKGTRAESKLVKFLAEQGIHADRKALHGAFDMGDVHVKVPRTGFEMVLEVKAGKQTSNPNRAKLTEWMRQTVIEGDNAGMPSALVVVRYQRSMKDAEIYYYDRLNDTWSFYWLDQFISAIS